MAAAALSGRAVAGSAGRSGELYNLPYRAAHRGDARRGAHARAASSQPPRARVADGPGRHADNPGLFHARLRPPSASPSPTDWPDMTTRRVMGALLLAVAAVCAAPDVRSAPGDRLAGVPRTVRVRHRRRSAPAGYLERRDRREHPMEDPGPGPRALEPDRVGRSDLRDERGQQPQGRRPSSPVSTATARRRRIARRSSGS